MRKDVNLFNQISDICLAVDAVNLKVNFNNKMILMERNVVSGNSLDGDGFSINIKLSGTSFIVSDFSCLFGLFYKSISEKIMNCHKKPLISEFS